MGWSMGWDVHNDGRTLRPVRADEYLIFGDEMPALVAPRDARQVFVLRGGKLIPDTVHVHSEPFLVTRWESLYSALYGTGTQATNTYDFPILEKVNPSFVPIIDESYRVVGHLGWIDGFEICVPMDTIQVGAKLGSILEKRRLGEIRQQFLADADKFDRGPYPNSRFHAATISPPPPPHLGRKLKPTIWDDARRGPLKGESDELRYQRNINYFLAGGGTAVVGRKFAFDLLAGLQYESFLERKGSQGDDEFWDLLSPPPESSPSGYRFLVLVRPDGYLQGVLGVAKVSPETRNERGLRIAFGIIDFALTFLMIFDLVMIPVALVHVALRIEIQAIKLAINPGAKAALKLAEQEAKRALELGAREAADAAAKAAAKEVEITEATVRAAMKDAPLKSQQERVSLPTIRKYVQMLREGKIPPAIHVDQGMIVEGNHRYIAGRIFGKDPPIQPWAGGRPAWAVSWEKIVIDTAEW